MSLPMPPALPQEPEATLEDRAHTAYQSDFGLGCPFVQFQVGDVTVERQPHIAKPTREYTYWHTVTSGTPESTRTRAETRRMRRIPWVKPIIDDWARSKVWWEYRESSVHWNIWHTGQRHVVIVKALSNGKFLLKTSYPTDFDITPWHKRYHEAKKAGRALADAP
jgi:hypothetical protein